MPTFFVLFVIVSVWWVNDDGCVCAAFRGCADVRGRKSQHAKKPETRNSCVLAYGRVNLGEAQTDSADEVDSQTTALTSIDRLGNKMTTERQYECIVLGASGYTGRYAAEHITTSLPTDFKWAVAGRNEGKLRQLVDEISTLNPNRLQPGVEVARLDQHDLLELAKKTKVLITTIGPYHKYGTAVVEACAEIGTHYLDVTGEVPWVYDMIQKYDGKAKQTGAIMIPQNGIESAPTDLMCWSLVSHIRETLNAGTAELVHSTYSLDSAPSGGTLATVLGIFDAYSLADFAKKSRPWSLCSVTPPAHQRSRPLLEVLTGLRAVSGLGTLTDSLQGPADVPIIHRSWGLIDGGRFYGPHFQLSSYMRARNVLIGFGIHIALTFGFLALALPPVRWLLKYFVYHPGQGPTKE